MTTPEEAVDVLNRALIADRLAISALVAHRVPCNDELAADPTVQVGAMPPDTQLTVGLLGILNGIFGTVPGELYGWIAAYTDPNGIVMAFDITGPNPTHGGASHG